MSADEIETNPRIMAELQWIKDNPVEHELRIIAGGGRELSLDELNARHNRGVGGQDPTDAA